MVASCSIIYVVASSEANDGCMLATLLGVYHQTISTQVGEIDHPGFSLPLWGWEQAAKNLLIPHTWKKKSPSHMEKSPSK